MKNDRIRAILLFFWVVLTVLINILAEVFERYPTLITPAGYAFLLWGPIYLGLIGLSVYQALPRQQRSERLRAIRGPLLVNLAANVAWVLAWHHDQIFLSLFAMATMADSLATAYARLDSFPVSSRAEFWLVRTPISVYLAWTTVATIVNTAVWLVASRVDSGDTAPFWAAMALTVAAIVCGVITLRQQDWAFALTALWALTAIAVQQSGTPPVAAAALLAASVVALAKTIGGITGIPAAPSRPEPTPDRQRQALPSGKTA
jgi:hypothetical protein